MLFRPGTLMSSGIGSGEASGPSYEAEAATLFSAMSSEPNATRKGHINTLVEELKAGGVWSKLDLLYVTAAHDAQAAYLNWITPASFPLVPVNSPTFLADRHVVGDGVSMHLTTGFTPSTHAVQMTQNSAMLAAWVRNDVSSATQYEVGGTTSGGSYINSRNSANITAKLNGGASSQALGAATSVGFTAIDRSASTGFEVYKNGALLGTRTDASVALMSVPLVLLRHSASYSTRQVAAAMVGGSLTAGEHAAMHTALNTYMLAVGAA